MSRVKQPTWYKPENTQPKLKVFNTFTHEKVYIYIFIFCFFKYKIIIISIKKYLSFNALIFNFIKYK